ncbi:hypothetical protein BBJ29_008522 [Phytophthora kernoviae]|uniref:Aminotransferase class V domain-containing protein n=1 Tax=Phytophthora kernoviae TaxID=325452 RepID=A0A3R7HGJ6_9STRA|nr:hypothetical protein BBJ29_008522 [Phytophthora kernoviae]
MVNEMAKLMEINALNMIALHFRRRLHQYIRFRYAKKGDTELKYRETRRLVNSCYRVRSAPEKDDDDIPTDKTVKWQIRANCAHFLHKLYDMLAWMEKVVDKHPKTKGARLYSLLPVATTFQAAYVKLNASTLHGLLARLIDLPKVENFLKKELNIVLARKRTGSQLPFDKKTFQKNRSEVIRKVFDVEQFETRNRKFVDEIKTNGYGASITMIRPVTTTSVVVVEKKVSKKKRKKNDDTAELVSKEKKMRKKKVKTPEEIAEENMFAKELFKLGPDYSPDVLTGIDPGMRSLVTAMSDRAKMKALDMLAKRLVPEASKQVCIAYGDWSRRTGIKGHASGTVKGFVEALKRRATVIPMDEYWRSITCCCCHQRLKQARLFTKMKRKEDEVGIRQKERLSMKEVKEIVEMARFRNPKQADKKVVLKCTRNVLRCTNSGCKANFWNRDVNAARNMLELLKSGLKGKHGARRLRAFRREEDLTQQLQDQSQDVEAPVNDQLSAQVQQSVALISSNVVGQHTLFDSPFGARALCYADFTASSKPLQCIEDYLVKEVMPLYGNTHTTTSITGLQTTCFRHEARQIVAQAVNAKITGRGAEDCVLFTGQGSTSAVNKLVSALGLQQFSNSSSNDSSSQRPVVFVGPFEHHSNLLPWRETAAEIVSIPENEQGLMDLETLKTQLELYADRPLKIGAFSAASNLTGVLTDVDAVSALLHQHGALACWDYATCAPYVNIDMNPVVTDEKRRPFVYKDAVFMSGHKFIGGPGSPGVLIVKKRLLTNAVPTVPGGGTVFFVTENDHRYLSNRAEREEGGTPDILGSVRLGLAFELKQRVGAKNIMTLERRNVQRVRESLRQNDHIVLLGRQSDEVEQIPVFSFLVRFGDRFLHYNFVCALLNDLFGIQTRGGCQCAGPYATRLLGLARQDVLALEGALIEKKEMLRPGFTRMSFPYFMSSAEVEHILAAVHFVANDGWKFLPQYKFNHKSGVWKHSTRFTKFPDRKWLSHFATSLEEKSRSQSLSGDEKMLAAHRAENLAEAQRLAAQVSGKNASSQVVAASASQMLEEADDEALRWFVYPSEATEAIKRGEKPVLTETIRGPYQPARYLTGEIRDQWKDVSTTVTASSVCGLATCCPVPANPSTSNNSNNHSKTFSTAAGSDRETGGKYPLRSTSNGLDVVDTPVVAKTNTDCSTANCSTGRCPVRTPPACSLGVTATTVQETTTAMAQKTAATKLFPTPPKKLMRWVGQAMMQWDMIQDGDRLLLGVSGGKDSLSLLHVLLHFQKRAPVRFELACATVDPQTASFDPSPLKEYMRALGVPYFYLSENIIARATCEMSGDSLCSYCSRMKRGLLYTCCRKEGYNKLVLAQHLDDLAESFFMSAMHNGQLRTMKAKYWNNQRDVEVLRPLAYVREVELKKFAYDSRLPVINENCPACFEEPKERHRVKKMLAQEESLYPDMYNSIRRALLPLMDDASYAPLEAVRTRIEQAKQQRRCVPSNKGKGQNKSAKANSTASSTSSSTEEEGGVIVNGEAVVTATS